MHWLPRAAGFWCWALFFASLAACTEDETGTEVVIVIDAETSVRPRIDDVVVRVTSGVGPKEDWTPRFENSVERQDGMAWPLEVSLVPRAGGAERNYEVVATAYGPVDAAGDRETLARVRAISGYLDGQSLRLPLLFDAPCLARDRLCGDDFSCELGDCVDPLVNVENLEPFERGRSDVDPVARDSGAPSGDAAGGGSSQGDGGSGGSGEVDGCPRGFIVEGSRCAPVLLALTTSEGELTPALTEGTTDYALAVPLLTPRIRLGFEVAEGVSVQVDGEPVAAETEHDPGPLAVGSTRIVVTLRHPDYGNSAYVLDVERHGAQRAYLKADNAGAEDHFGFALDAWGDIVAVGAPDEDSSSAAGSDDGSEDSGAVYVFERSGSSYAQVALLKGEPVAAGARFGAAVALRGDTLAVGAPEDGGGAVHVFVRSAGSWMHQGRLSVPAGNADLGKSVWLGDDWLLAGAPGDDQDTTDGGAVFVFSRSGDTWSGGTRVSASTAQATGYIGARVACDASYCAAGASGERGAGGADDHGATYVFARSGAGLETPPVRLALPDPGDRSLEFFGEDLAIEDDLLAVGASFATPTGQTLGAGIVQLYERDGADWMRGQELFASNATAFATFGASMALRGDVLLISAFREDGGGAGVDPAPGAAMQSDSGAVYLFERAGPGEPFVELLRIKAQVPGEHANYGHDLALVDDTLVVGAPGESSAATGVDGSQGGVGSPESGAAYVVR